MMEEIRKRPFMRPLFYWVAGIILQVCFPLRQLSCLLLLPVIIAVILSGLADHKDTCFRYDSRWAYGMAISCLFVFLSVQFTVLAEHRSAKSGDSGWLKERAYRVQEYMVEKLDGLHVSDREKSILATITVNYRKAMNQELRDRFSVTGVAHLLSVSGFHVGIVAALLSVLFSVFPNRFVFRRMKFVLILLFVWMFTYIAGLSAAAVRSALMFTIYVIGLQFQYRPDRYNTWAAAAFCMLVYDPFYLFDVGFQLSFMAVFFILYLQPRFYQLIEVRNPLFAVPWGSAYRDCRGADRNGFSLRILFWRDIDRLFMYELIPFPIGDAVNSAGFILYAFAGRNSRLWVVAIRCRDIDTKYDVGRRPVQPVFGCYFFRPF